jgi:hypothetical protein
MHEARNNSDEIRVVLFGDIVRKLPWYPAAPNRAFIGAIRRSPFIKRAWLGRGPAPPRPERPRNIEKQLLSSTLRGW